jgi:hypothetical protein
MSNSTMPPVGSARKVSAAAAPDRVSAPRSNAHLTRGSPRRQRDRRLGDERAQRPEEVGQREGGRRGGRDVRPFEEVDAHAVEGQDREHQQAEQRRRRGDCARVGHRREGARPHEQRGDDRTDQAARRRGGRRRLVGDGLRVVAQHLDRAGGRLDGHRLQRPRRRLAGDREHPPGVGGEGEPDAVAPADLRVVHRGVGGTEQRLRALAVLGVARDARAEGHRHELAVELERGPLHAGAQLVGQRARGRRLDPGQQEAELLAAEARGDAAVAGALGERAREMADDAVAGQVAEAVVEPAQVVEVDHDDREGLVAARGGAQRIAEQVAEVLGVEQARLGVGARLVTQGGDE